ncbi:MAG: 2-isopropylmalate synthase [Clostridia bacterium]|nr:2-isopropylmalate synthase [Clostridia bacterium]
MKGYEKYTPFGRITQITQREWPDKLIEKAPIWCSVDLRDGNQALIDPMNVDEKIRMFEELVRVGFKEIEVGFPSASETEYEYLRALIDRNLIPDDVTIQVLVQAREHLIRKTFEAIDGAKNVIVHFYNSTSTLQRKVVFHKDMDAITEIAVNGAKLIRELTEQMDTGHMNIRFEYSPESFSGTEPEFAVAICDAVAEAIGADEAHPIIFNLPSTVQLSTPNIFADQIEYFSKHIAHREAVILSVHPHNDRGTGVADAELALLAGADRIEGTLFGNGERTGNVDIVTLALNMFTQGVDPQLDFSDIKRTRRVYEQCTRMRVHERTPYAGDLVFTAFSGSHQDAIKKGTDYMAESHSDKWEVPYLPISPADVGREYEPIIRINSQSGTGGAAFIMQQMFGYYMPKDMHPEFGYYVKAAADAKGKELTPQEIFDIFDREYLHARSPYALGRHDLYNTNAADDDTSVTRFSGTVKCHNEEIRIEGEGNGPIDAFFDAMKKLNLPKFKFLNYHEHAIGSGADAKACAYVELLTPEGANVFGVGVHSNINVASIKAVVSAVNRALNRYNQ